MPHGAERMTGDDYRIDEEFELPVAEGRVFQTLYVRILDRPRKDPAEVPPEELRKLALEGSIDAQVGWAHRLLHGHGVARDPEAAFRWFNRAAGGGDPEALNMVGRCYELGWGVPINATEAAFWFGRAAEKGDAWGEFNLATLYTEGRGVPADIGRALTLLVRSARQGNPKAMCMIGNYREASEASRRSQRRAGLWYRWAAERGCFRGQFHHARHLFAAGRADEAAGLFRAALAHAPAAFRHEALRELAANPRPELRALAAEIAAADRAAPG